MADTGARADDNSGPLEAIIRERLNPKSGLVEKLPLLDLSSCEEISFLPYVAPILQHNGEPDPVWLEAIEGLDADLNWLLKLPHANFWNQVLFDNSLKKCLDSYLRYAPRSFDPPVSLPMKVKETQRNIHKRVFMVFVRMATATESEAHYFTPAAHASIIYQNYLFDIPKMMDLCILYGASNQPLLAKMLANVFKVQPQYKKDWSILVPSFARVFSKVSDEVLPSQTTVLLNEEPKSLAPRKLSDLILYLSDTTSTLKAFLEVYPPAIRELVDGDFLETLISFYESVVPVLVGQWSRAKQSMANMVFVKGRFRQFKKDSAWIVNRILSVYLDPGNSEEVSSQLSLDSFVSAVTKMFIEKMFLREFQKHYSLTGIVYDMQKLHPELPDSHFDYIVSSLDGGEAKVNERADGLSDSLDTLVSHVKELLPHLGDGFIELCLKEFDNSPETVVDRVLEGNLPPSLGAEDQGLSAEELRKRSSQIKAKSTELSGKGSSDVNAEDGLSEERLNVFDNDEFDVFNEDISVDLSRVHFGKRFEPTSASSILNNKAHLETTREIYKEYEMETTWSDQELGEGGMVSEQYEFDQYSDEYDDTYDSHSVGAADNDTSEELFSVRRLNDKGQYSHHHSHFGVSEDSSPVRLLDHSHATMNPGRVTIAKQPTNEQREHHSAHKPKTNVSPRKTHGSRGQSSEVKQADSERARQLKEKNKAKRANHNRKAMADKKRARGMGAPPG